MKANHSFQSIPSELEITEPSGSTYLKDVFHNELLSPTETKLLSLIDEHLLKYG